MDHPSDTSLCPVAPSPTDTPFPFFFFFWREGAAVHRLSRTDHPSSNCPSKLADKLRQIVHLKLKQFHFQIKTYYISGANYQTDNPSHTNDLSGVKRAISVINEFAPRPWVERSRVCFCFFTKIILILTVDISMRKIILEVKYCMKHTLKFFKRIAYFIPRWS